MIGETGRTEGWRPGRLLPALATVWILATLAGGAVQAGGFYLGAGLGTTSTDAEVADLDDGSLTSASLDDKDDALQAFAGFRFNGLLALELCYTDAGKIAFDAVSDGSQVLNDGYDAGPIAATIETQTASLQVLVGVPLGRFRLYARAGGHAWAADGGVTNGGFDYDLDDFDLEESGTGLVYGAGVAFHPIPRLGVRADWQVSRDAIVGEQDLETLTAAVYVRF